jgi:small subunit ribosomal protein S1
MTVILEAMKIWRNEYSRRLVSDRDADPELWDVALLMRFALLHRRSILISHELGVVTGVIDFGAFMNVDGIEGLIHISEISWERVDNPKNYVKVGDTVKAKIIAIDKDRLSLSLKQMQEDPWLSEVKKFKAGETVEGKITRITPFGAFVQLSPSVEALVHVSEMSDDEGVDPEKLFQLNEKKQFKVLDIDTENRKIALSLKNTK